MDQAFVVGGFQIDTLNKIVQFTLEHGNSGARFRVTLQEVGANNCTEAVKIEKVDD